MKHMYVIYDCNICEEFHILKSTWTADCEMGLKHWNLNMDSEVVAIMLSQAFQAFAKIHPAVEFDNSRLMFSQVFEEGDEDEEGTS